MRRIRVFLALGLWLVGCSPAADGNPFDAGGASDGPGGSSGVGQDDAGGTSASGDPSESGGSDDGGDDGFIYDVGAGGDNPLPTDGCQKIDFLFVVDNSASMGAHQAALAASFGGFMDAIFATVQAQDYHVMVVDSDGDTDIASACEPCTPDSFWCGDWCEAKAQLDVACERTLGAGEVAPYNNGASNTICGVPNGQRYLTSDSSPDEIKSLFACMAKVGIFGSGAELPMDAIVEAVGAQSQMGGCNEGFLRSDAILVTTFITDDYPVAATADNASTVGTPEQWYDAVVQAKNGNADNVVVLGIMNTPDAACVDGAGGPPVHPTQRFIDFVDKFDSRGLSGNICTDDYAGFFEQAVGLIDTACDEYVPEG